MTYSFQGDLYRTADARNAAIAYANMTANGLNSPATIDEMIRNGLTPENAADDAISGWDLLAVYDEDGSDWRGSKEGQPVHEGLTREILVEAHRDFFRTRPDYEPIIELMDDDLREEMHNEVHEGHLDTIPSFAAEYAKRHLERFGEEFAPMTGGAW